MFSNSIGTQPCPSLRSKDGTTSSNPSLFQHESRLDLKGSSQVLAQHELNQSASVHSPSTLKRCQANHSSMETWNPTPRIGVLYCHSVHSLKSPNPSCSQTDVQIHNDFDVSLLATMPSFDPRPTYPMKMRLKANISKKKVFLHQKLTDLDNHEAPTIK